MKAIDLSIIIVSYNTREFLRNCISSILNSVSSNLSYEIIVVDNASKDGTVGMIEERFITRHSGKRSASWRRAHPESLMTIGDSGQARMTGTITLIQNKKNIGFSKANNIGVKQARGRYLLFLNPDTIVYPNTLETMIDFMNTHRDAAVATCRVELPNGELDDSCHRGFPTPWNAFCYFSGLSKLFPKSKLFSGYTLTFMDLSTIHEIDSAAGSFMLVRRKPGESVGWWDEEYFFYGEDLDFCYRLKQEKWKIYYVPTVSILHYKGISGGIKKISKEITTADSATKKLATKARFKAMKIFYRKHYIKKYPVIITWLVNLGISVKLWISSAKQST